MTVRGTILMLAALVTGCASGGGVVDLYSADSESLRRFQSIRVIDDDVVQSSYRSLGKVQGYYCKKASHWNANMLSDAASLEAIDQVKIKAAQMGAVNVSTPSCEVSEKTDFSRNCYGTVICTADALVPGH